MRGRSAAHALLRTGLLVALLAASGCSGRASESPDEVPTFLGSVNLEVGEIDGDDPYLFTRIPSIVEDPGGRVIVADMQSHEVRVFGPDGRFLFRFGGQGEGPGELTRPCCLTFGPDGALWVREETRYSVFRLAAAGADYERGVRIAHASVGLVAPITFDAEGRLVDIGSIMVEDGYVTARLHHGTGGAVDTVLMADPERQATGSTTVERMFGEMAIAVHISQPSGPRWIHAHGPGGMWAEAVTSEYSVALHHPDGTVSRIEGPALPGPPLSPAERERAQASIDRDLSRADLRNHPFGIPDRKPPLADIFFDGSGRLWVEKAAADGDELREADVYAGTELVARYRWPRRVRVGEVPWVSESTLYGTTSNSMDVQRVARVRFEPHL